MYGMVEAVKSEMQIVSDFFAWCSERGYCLVDGNLFDLYGELELEDARVSYERVVSEYWDEKRKG